MPAARLLLFATAVLLVGGCTSSGSSIDPTGDGGLLPSGDAGTDAGANRLHVRSYLHFVSSDGGVTSLPDRLTEANVEALQLDGGTFSRFPGTVTDAGVAEIAAPEGSKLYVRLGSSYVVTSGRDVDFSTWQAGRPDLWLRSLDGLDGRVTLTSLAPVVDEGLLANSLSVVSPETDFSSSITLSATDAGYTEYSGGATLVGSASANPRLPPGRWIPEFEPSKGDTWWLNQLVEHDGGVEADGGAITYRTVARSAQVPAPAGDGGFDVQAELTEVPQTHALAFEWRRASFGSAAAQVNPNGRFGGTFLQVVPMLSGSQSGTVGNLGLLLEASTSDVAGSTLVERYTYGSPYPPSWQHLVVAVSGTFLTVRPPDSNSGTVSASVATYDRADALAGPLEPRLTPPRNLTVDGADAYSGGTFASASPVVAWTEPTVGSPSHFVLSVFEVGHVANATTFQRTLVARIWVGGSERSLQLPPGVLGSGKRYVLRLTATDSDVPEPLREPNRRPVRWAFAEALSGMFAVP